LSRFLLPLIEGPGVEFVGEINEREKTKFLGEAAALLFPVDWPEPFGLVMIEAMACGTPVLAFRCGSVAEVIEDGITGKVVNSEVEAIAALPEILSYDRRAVRRRFEERRYLSALARGGFPPDADAAPGGAPGVPRLGRPRSTTPAPRGGKVGGGQRTLRVLVR
jgi:glycosyltransferase involved in cell wall biosynthesis